MNRFFAALVLGGVGLTLAPAAPAQSETQPSAVKSDSPDLPSLPPIPQGKSTIIGGEIRNVDPVLDRFTLKVFGQKSIKILYDSRTQVFRDGKRVPLRDLHPEAHASIQTILDGGNVFALSIHMLSQTPEGDLQGHILSYNAGTRELTVSSSSSREPIRLLVRADTNVVRQGQTAFTSEPSGDSDLVSGALVAVVFQSDKQGHGVASHITVLARPGSSFVFSGAITSLDVHAGLLVVVDPRDDKNYQINFDSTRIPGSENLRSGDHVRVTASFDGTVYTAVDIVSTRPTEP
jgi:hypothetical protein